MKYEEYQLDTGWACGLIIVESSTSIIIDGAPIFKKLIGVTIRKLPKSYKINCLHQTVKEDLSK